MTDEEIKALQDSLADLEKQIADLTAERDSLKEENDALNQTNSEIKTELGETKKLNFTLSRQIGREPAKSAEELLNEMLR